MTDAETPHELVLVARFAASPRAADGGTEQELHQNDVITDEHFEALKAGTQTSCARLADYLAR
jgi:hypothetical protein